MYSVQEHRFDGSDLISWYRVRGLGQEIINNNNVGSTSAQNFMLGVLG